MALASTLFLSLPGESTTGTCPSTSSYEWTVDRWSPADGDLAGMRSPIELRKSGDVCSPNGVVYQWVGVWTDSAISQIGWGSQHTLGFCRFTFWETSSYSSGIQWSRCGTDPPGTVRLFKVEDTQYGPPTFIHRFSIYDCGVSGWNGCGSALDAGPLISAFNESHAGVSSEVVFSASCLDRPMGTQNLPAVFGGAQGDIEGKKAYAGSYSVRPLTDYVSGVVCSHHDWGVHNDMKMTVFDDRN